MSLILHLAIVGQDDDCWIIEPPQGLKLRPCGGSMIQQDKMNLPSPENTDALTMGHVLESVDHESKTILPFPNFRFLYSSRRDNVW